MSINSVCISGNITRDAEMRMTNSGTVVANFGVAVNDRRKNPQTGEWEDAPNFVDCVIFGARAEKLERALSKGTKVAIVGKLRHNTWTDRSSGERRSKIEVVVDDLDFMGPRPGQGARRMHPAQGNYTQDAQPPRQTSIYDDSVPF